MHEDFVLRFIIDTFDSLYSPRFCLAPRCFTDIRGSVLRGFIHTFFRYISNQRLQ